MTYIENCIDDLTNFKIDLDYLEQSELANTNNSKKVNFYHDKACFLCGILNFNIDFR